MRTYIQKGHYGWNAETAISIGSGYRLTITTMKRSSGKLQTIASVGKVEGGYVSHMVYSDLCRVIISSDAKKVTEKVVVVQHNEAIVTKLVDIMEAVKAHYPSVEFSNDVGGVTG